MVLKNKKPRFKCLLLHGLCEHEYRMYELGKFLHDLGGEVHIPTHLGHGSRAFQWDALALQDFYLNPTERIPHFDFDAKLAKKAFYKERQHISMEDHLIELEQSFHEMNVDDTPIFIGGLSMGGLLALALSIRLQGENNFAKAFYVSPALGASAIELESGLKAYASRATDKGMKTLQYLREKHFPGVELFCAGLAKLKINVPCTDLDLFVSDLRTEQELFRNDPLIAKHVPLAYLNEIQKLMIEVWDEEHQDLFQSKECAMIWSAGDQIVNPQAITRFCKKYSLQEDFYSQLQCHDILRSSQKEHCFQFIKDFLEL